MRICVTGGAGEENTTIKSDKLSEAEKGWLAAAIDGEGYLTLSPRKRRLKNGVFAKDGMNFYIDITNTNKDFLVYAESLFNKFEKTSTLVHYKNSIRPDRKPVYDIRIYQRQAVASVLSEIIPYLIIKKKKAIEMIEYALKYLGNKGYWREKYTLDQKLETLKLYDSGLSFETVSKQLNIPYTTIRNWNVKRRLNE